jgi:hypothetical protein
VLQRWTHLQEQHGSLENALIPFDDALRKHA